MQESDRAKLFVIAGPTASGKTSIAVEVAKELDGEIVGADSMQVFRHLNIGTAKPDEEELKGVCHHLIDVADPDEPYDASRFVKEADEVIEDIHRRGKRVIVAGGTGLYLRVLLHGLQGAPAPSPEIRGVIQRKADALGWPELHKSLVIVDPISAEKLHPNDGVRILRALEVFEASGIPISEWQRRHGFAKWRYEALVLGIERPREELYSRINFRVDEMMEMGFLSEVKSLLENGYSAELKPMQGLGYKRLVSHLLGEIELDEAVEETKKDTRRFSKRQLTWFGKEPGLTWAQPNAADLVDRANEFWSK